MKKKIIIPLVLIAVCAVALMGGCVAYGNADATEEAQETGTPELRGMETQPKASESPTGTVTDVAKSTVKPTETPQPAPSPASSQKPTVTVKPAATPKAEPTTGKAQEQSGESGSQAEQPAPVQNTPQAQPPVQPDPAPVATPQSTPEPAPTPITEPTPAAAPVPSAGRTICNTCGADITGNVAAHGDSHLLNNESFSYRVE